MFGDCANLSQAPILPAPKLVKGCYMEMFSHCAKLSSITVNFTDWGMQFGNGDDARNWNTEGWLSGISPNGTFICPKVLPKEFSDNKIPENWKVERAKK
jgi:hypothetical protein